MRIRYQLYINTRKEGGVGSVGLAPGSDVDALRKAIKKDNPNFVRRARVDARDLKVFQPGADPRAPDFFKINDALRSSDDVTIFDTWESPIIVLAWSPYTTSPAPVKDIEKQPLKISSYDDSSDDFSNDSDDSVDDLAFHIPVFVVVALIPTLAEVAIALTTFETNIVKWVALAVQIVSLSGISLYFCVKGCRGYPICPILNSIAACACNGAAITIWVLYITLKNIVFAYCSVGLLFVTIVFVVNSPHVNKFL